MDIKIEDVQKSAIKAMEAQTAINEKLAKHESKFENLDAVSKDEFSKLTAQVNDALELSQKYNAEQEAHKKSIDELTAAMARPTGGESKAKTEEVKDELKGAFDTFLRSGGGSERSDFADYLEKSGDKVSAEAKSRAIFGESKALSVNSNANGGFLTMPDFGGVINTRLFESSPMRQLASSMQINSDTLELVLDNDEAACRWTNETTAPTDTATPQVDKRVIAVHEMEALPKVTQKMLDDGIVDIEGWLAGKVAESFARKEATAFVNGTGAGQPVGFLAKTTTSAAYDSANIQAVASATSNAIAYDDLVNIQNSLKEPYQGNATWLMKRATHGELMKLKDGESRPIFNLMYNENSGLEKTIFDRPVRFADDMPAKAADALAIAYGDFRQGYMIVDRIGIRVLRDPYTNKPYVVFYTTKRVGGDVINTEALKALKLSG